jgi:ABC-type uncharacterized transport system permease subunit
MSAGITFRDRPAHLWAVLTATAAAYVKSNNAYLIDIIRIPLYPLAFYATSRISYAVAGQERVDGADPSAFLLVGMIGLITWSSTIWASGYAIERERAMGTVAALFLSPASRVAVIAGYGLGSFLWLLPSYAVVGLLAAATGARLRVADPPALLAAAAALALGSLAVGFALAGLFILSRRANLPASK